jgi:membrane-bound lytic murein transglycosylase D
VLPAHAEETFPLPEELQPDVDFWVSIFTRYSTGEGVLHDNRNLAVVYERIDMPTGISRKERNRRVKKRRDALIRVLHRLADGKRDNLSAEEARILALWPGDVSNDELRAATKRIRFQQGLADRFREGLQRSGRWRDFIETEFTALGVPLELAALPHVESSYNPDARSHVGASGIWQFTRSTGRRFMRVDHVIDERNDPFAATRSAGQLLAYNYSIAGNWPMAITAYNHGLAGVRRAQRIYGDTAYVDIFRNYNGRTFGFASRNFYLAFLAAKEVDQNPERYFPGVVRESPTAYAELKLPDYIPADDLASELGVSPRYIAKHNPALQPTVWEGRAFARCHDAGPGSYAAGVSAGGQVACRAAAGPVSYRGARRYLVGDRRPLRYEGVDARCSERSRQPSPDPGRAEAAAAGRGSRTGGGRRGERRPVPARAGAGRAGSGRGRGAPGRRAGARGACR